MGSYWRSVIGYECMIMNDEEMWQIVSWKWLQEFVKYSTKPLRSTITRVSPHFSGDKLAKGPSKPLVNDYTVTQCVLDAKSDSVLLHVAV